MCECRDTLRWITCIFMPPGSRVLRQVIQNRLVFEGDWSIVCSQDSSWPCVMNDVQLAGDRQHHEL